MAGQQVERYPLCFGCGTENPIGLRLDMRLEDGQLTAEFFPREEHQGWPGVIHGGVVAALLYEVLENLSYYLGLFTMTRSMETRYRRPAAPGNKIVARSRLVDRSGRILNVSATLTGEEGELLAEGTATLVVLSQAQKERLGLE